ncbi:MAG: hypothetical protein HYT87_11365 [Nitrospirae bacterium]|nr:hypothetical protein [Nitrospirota bacterium]
MFSRKNRKRAASLDQFVRMLYRSPKPNLTLEEALTQIGPGWHPILNDLWPRLEGAQIVQVKEKFGGLRVYCLKDGKREGHHEELLNSLREAEGRSYRTCEVCGEPGSLIAKPRQWNRTRCAAHRDVPAPDSMRDPQYQRAWISVLIQSRQHLLIGTSAVKRYLTTVQGETELDFLVRELFTLEIPAFLSHWSAEHRRNGDAIIVPAWGMDFINAEASPTLLRIFDKEATFGRYATASLEALAATKFPAAISPSRSMEKRRRDVEELAGLVRLAGFSRRRALAVLKDEHRDIRKRARDIFDALKKGRGVEL